MLLDLWGLFQRDTRKIKGASSGVYVWNQRGNDLVATVSEYDDEDEIVTTVLAQAAYIYYWRN